jgi:hypothetical protein
MTKFPRALEKAIFDRDKEICQICGRVTEFGDGELDHVVPKSKGGSDAPENLQWVCHRCNKLKSNKRTNEQVREILSLPEDFEDIMKFRNQKKAETESTIKTQSKLPTLSRQGLDIPAVEECMLSLQESFQNETIIDEVCNQITPVEEATKEFVHIGFHYRLPRLWFLPYEITHQSFYNAIIFRELGRRIALSEMGYLEQSILNNERISRMKLEFSPEGIFEALNEIQGRGFKPSIITFPLRFWTKLHFWSGNASVEYSTVVPAPKLNATLRLNENRLGIIYPLGSFPKESMLIGEGAIEWLAKRNDEGALYAVFGNHQLYPLKYVELLTGISVKSVIHPERILILNYD